MNQRAGCAPPPRALSAGLRRAGHLADRASTVAFGLAVALLLTLVLGMVAGFQPLIDHSGSMSPAIRAGDLLVTHDEAATSIRSGDIVTFINRALRSRLVTHRVVAVHASGPRIDFVTRGDANSASESWSVARGASVGKLMFRVPAVGRSLAVLAAPWPRMILLSLAALVLSTALLRRLWKP